MKEVNYISHLNAVLRKFANDSKITSSHRSLYLAFFELWNQKHFPLTIMVNRKQVMDLAKICSRTTYHKFIRELNSWNYLQYHPSTSPKHGSLVDMFRFDTLADQKMDGTCSIVERVPDQKMVSFNKHKNKHIINSFKQTYPKNEQVVILYFKSEKRSSLEAKKFYNFYESIDWKLNGKHPITNWKACARNWMIRADEMKKTQNFASESRLKINQGGIKNINYEEPL